jgi:glycosyltransferase involved in cell wall biosynthesis
MPSMTNRNQCARSEREAVRSTTIAPPLSLAFISSLRGWGGGEKWMLHAAVAMRDRGHPTALVVQPGSELAARGEVAGLRVRPVRMGGWLDPRTLIDLALVLRRLRADVVCANLDKEIRQARLAAPLAGRSVRLVVRRGSPVPIKNTWHYRLVYEHGVDRLICNAASLVDDVCGGAPWFDRGRVRVIPNGVDADALAEQAAAHDVRAELGIAPGAPVVACVGEVGHRKGQEHVLAAAAALRDRFPGAVWLIAGEGDGRVALTGRADHMGLLAGGYVRFLGFRRDVPSILAAADVVVLPSRSEGFPNTLLEAMALGRAVAASRADGIPELVLHEETGLLHPVDDVDTFTAHIAALLADPALRARLGADAARRARTTYDEPTIMTAIEAALTDWPTPTPPPPAG